MITTFAAVRAAFERTIRYAQSVGVDTSRWALRDGSATYGRPFLILDRDPRTGGESSLAHLGATRVDAYNTLQGMTSAFAQVLEASLLAQRRAERAGAELATVVTVEGQRRVRVSYDAAHPFDVARGALGTPDVELADIDDAARVRIFRAVR